MISQFDFLCAVLVRAVQKRKGTCIRLRADQLQQRINSCGSPFVFSNSGAIPFSPDLNEQFHYFILSGFGSYRDLQSPEELVVTPLAFQHFDRLSLDQAEVSLIERAADAIISEPT